MILPIYTYGHTVLKKMTTNVPEDFPQIQDLISDMWATMYNAHGVGLAAPQIGRSLRLFIVDTIQLKEETEPDNDGIKKVFINAEIIEEFGKEWSYEEGCLSIPALRGDVDRKPEICIKYQDENFEWHEDTYEGVNARVIQHEYDHVLGILFTEKLKPLKRKLIQRKLEKMKKGKVNAEYKIKLP